MIPEGSLARLLVWRLAERPDFEFLWVEDDGPWSVARLAEAASELAHRMEAAGVAPGDRVLVRLGNDERFLAALVAVWLRQSLAVTMHPSTPVLAAESIAAEMGTSVVICASSDELASGELASGELASGELASDELVSSPRLRLLTFDPIDRRAARPVILPIPDAADDDPAVVLLTSGSTGRPKGVTLSHGNLWASLRSTVLSFSRDGGPKPLGDPPPNPNLVANPLSHTGGLIRLLLGLYVGRPLVLLRKFDPILAARVVREHGINNLTINPSMIKMLLDGLPAGGDLGPVRYVSSGTAPLAPALREAFEARFAVPVLQSYGQTEVSGAIAIENVRDVLAGNRRPGSVGKPLPGMDVRILDSDGNDLPAGEDGEITVRSRAATVGYLGDAGTPAMRPGGWLRTGDIGHLDREGYLYITGRLRSVIICGGFNVIPEEVEAALIDGTHVTDAAVVGLPDTRLGEIPVAVVEPVADVDTVMGRARDRLVPYKRPRRIFSVAALPRLPMGKVDKPAVSRLAGELLQQSEPASASD